VETSTPAFKSGEFVNQLDPLLRLYDSSGNLVASDDNSASDKKNATLNFHAPKGGEGIYVIEVTASPASAKPTGEYILDIKGNQANSAPPRAAAFAVLAVPLGDANLDGVFDRLDLVEVLQGGKYLTRQDAVWGEGDWNADGQFDQLDLVAALQSGRYVATDSMSSDDAFAQLALDFEGEQNDWLSGHLIV
jgi:hypothetical protein